jgi:hypothetical protein
MANLVALEQLFMDFPERQPVTEEVQAIFGMLITTVYLAMPHRSQDFRVAFTL